MQAKNNEADDAGMDGVVQLLFDVIVAEASFTGPVIVSWMPPAASIAMPLSGARPNFCAGA